MVCSRGIKVFLSGMFSVTALLAAVCYGSVIAEEPEEQLMVRTGGYDGLVNVVQTMAEGFMKKNTDVKVIMTGGGSKTGIESLISGKREIGNASREMTEEEIEQAEEAGIKVRRVVIGRCALCVVVNVKNPIAELTLDEVGKIFRGEITNWREAGGRDAKIVLYGLRRGSEINEFFRSKVVKGEFSRGMIGCDSLAETVGKDELGIGYVPLGYVKDSEKVKVVSVAEAEGGECVSPLNDEGVVSDRYPLTQLLIQYFREDASSGTLEFIEYELGEEGQKVMVMEGFSPASNADKVRNGEVLDGLSEAGSDFWAGYPVHTIVTFP